MLRPMMPFPPWLAELLPFRRAMHTVEGLNVHVMEDGDPAGRPVLMLHGNPTWGFLYRKVALALRGSNLRVIMPDLVGLGFSDHPREPGFHSMARHGEIMAKLIAQLGLANLIFVGQDWGGPIGLRAIAHEPKRMTCLVILNTAISPPKAGFRPTMFHRFSHLPLVSDAAFRLLGFPQNMLGRVQGDSSSISGLTARAYRLPLRNPSTNRAPLDLARLVPDSLEHPSIADLRITHDLATNFTGPIEIVWGDRDPILGRVRTHLERSLPRARVTRTNAGHFLQEEVPNEIAGAIQRVASASLV